MIQRILWAALLSMVAVSVVAGQMRTSDRWNQRDRELREVQTRYQRELENHRRDCAREERRIDQEYRELRERINRRYSR